jgi:hypothetical protein
MAKGSRWGAIDKRRMGRLARDDKAARGAYQVTRRKVARCKVARRKVFTVRDDQGCKGAWFLKKTRMARGGKGCKGTRQGVARDARVAWHEMTRVARSAWQVTARDQGMFGMWWLGV